MFVGSALGRRDLGLCKELGFTARLLLGLNIYKLSDESLERCSPIDGRVSWHLGRVRWLIPGLGHGIQRISACRELAELPQTPGSPTAPAAFAGQGMEGAKLFFYLLGVDLSFCFPGSALHQCGGTSQGVILPPLFPHRGRVLQFLQSSG